MAQLLSVSVGGISFGLGSEIPIGIELSDPGYNGFIENAVIGPTVVRANVRLVMGGMPDLSGLEQLFENREGTQRIFAEEGVRWIVQLLPSSGIPIWCAEVHLDSADIALYCGDALLVQKDGETIITCPVTYPLDLILVMHILAVREGAVLHAGGVGLGRNGLVFCGKSGAGKSTLLRQFASRKDIVSLSDDRIVVRKTGDCFEMFGTPWLGDQGVAANERADLAAIFFIRHDTVNAIREVGKRETIERLLPTVSIPWYDRELAPRILSFCEDLIVNIPAYELSFKPDEEVVDLLTEFQG